MAHRLMTTPAEVALSRLSRDLYVQFLEKASRRGYAFVRFRDFIPGAAPLPPRFIALRHDVDFAPRYSVEMAELEHEAGVASTYHVLVDGQFYNPLQPDVVRQVRRIHSLGHEVGLHFAVNNAVEPDIGREVAFRLEILASILGAPVQSFSQHDMVNDGVVRALLPPEHPACVDAAVAIREHDLLYVSDSAMKWRRHTFDSALDEGRNLGLLAHPHSWLHGGEDYVAMVRDLEAREAQALADRYDTFVNALPGYYARRAKEGI